jgi:hypothetical protein
VFTQLSTPEKISPQLPDGTRGHVILRSIRRLASEMADQDCYRVKLETVHRALQTRLAEAGFSPVPGDQGRHFSAAIGLSLVSRVRSKWLHPECEVPMVAETRVRTSINGLALGAVDFLVEIGDERRPGGPAGMLRGSSFSKVTELCGVTHFESTHEWRAWIDGAVKGLDLVQIEPVLASAVARLESQVCP